MGSLIHGENWKTTSGVVCPSGTSGVVCTHLSTNYPHLWTNYPRGRLAPGGNATTAYNLLACDFLFEDFYILAVDIIGHPGKSAENSLPASGYDYGRWAGEVIDRLGFDRISLFGGSFGGERLPFSGRRSHWESGEDHSELQDLPSSQPGTYAFPDRWREKDDCRFFVGVKEACNGRLQIQICEWKWLPPDPEVYHSNSKKTPSSVHKLNSWTVGIEAPVSEQGGNELPAHVPFLFVSVSHIRCE